jgi:hypothetical protein
MKLKLSNMPGADVKETLPTVITPQVGKITPPERLEDVDTTHLLPRQVPAVFTLSRALAQLNATLDASDTGTGKTYVGCGVARQLGLRPLVMCAKANRITWIRTLRLFGVEPLDVLSYEKVRAGNTPWCKWESPTKMKADGKFVWKLPLNSMLILDEVHRCNATNSQNAKMLIAARAQGVPILMASATAASSPLEMRGIGYALGLHWMQNFWQWCRQHGCEANPFGGLHFDKNDERNKKIMLGIHKQLFPARAFRTRIDELGDEFPPTSIYAEEADMGANTKKINMVYGMMQDAIARLEKRSENYSASIFAEIMKARMSAELLKIPALTEMAHDGLDEGMSVILFVNFNDTALTLKHALKDFGMIVGGQKEADRNQAIDDFQANKLRGLICNIRAGGESISLHDLHGGHPRLSIISPNYSAIQMKQVFGRPWRTGAKTKSIQRIIFAADTIEETACDAVRSKLQNLSLLNDGDLMAGIQF